MDGHEEAPSIKQQLVETIRNAESLVITTQNSPGKDAIAAAIGLHLLLEKLDKVAEVVVASDVPEQLQFLPHEFINKQLQGQRDFVIELDQSRAEADSLKYVNENNKLKIYITPYNGSFVSNDVSFDYGDYHCDAIIGLGVHNVSDLTDSVTSEQKLIQNAKFLFINPGPGDQTNENALNWNDPNAGSICEMVMSMSEALGSGMLDEDIASALMTGIMERTEHFTNQTTTPKVMTMSAQLLAAGARQAEIVKRLSQPDRPPETTQQAGSGQPKEDKEQPQQQEKSTPNEFQLRQPKSGQSSGDKNSSQQEGATSSEVSVRGHGQQGADSQDSSSAAASNASSPRNTTPSQSTGFQSGQQNPSNAQSTDAQQAGGADSSQSRSSGSGQSGSGTSNATGQNSQAERTTPADGNTDAGQNTQTASSTTASSQVNAQGTSPQQPGSRVQKQPDPSTYAAPPQGSGQQVSSDSSSPQQASGQQPAPAGAQQGDVSSQNAPGSGNGRYLDPRSQGAVIEPPPSSGNQTGGQNASAAAAGTSNTNQNQQQSSQNQTQQQAPQPQPQPGTSQAGATEQQGASQQNAQSPEQSGDTSGGSDVEAARKAVEQAQQQAQASKDQNQSDQQG